MVAVIAVIRTSPSIIAIMATLIFFMCDTSKIYFFGEIPALRCYAKFYFFMFDYLLSLALNMRTRCCFLLHRLHTTNSEKYMLLFLLPLCKRHKRDICLIVGKYSSRILNNYFS